MTPSPQPTHGRQELPASNITDPPPEGTGIAAASVEALAGAPWLTTDFQTPKNKPLGWICGSTLAAKLPSTIVLVPLVDSTISQSALPTLVGSLILSATLIILAGEPLTSILKVIESDVLQILVALLLYLMGSAVLLVGGIALFGLGILLTLPIVFGSYAA